MVHDSRIQEGKVEKTRFWEWICLGRVIELEENLLKLLNHKDLNWTYYLPWDNNYTFLVYLKSESPLINQWHASYSPYGTPYILAKLGFDWHIGTPCKTKWWKFTKNLARMFTRVILFAAWVYDKTYHYRERNHYKINLK